MIKPTSYEDETNITKLVDAKYGELILAEVTCIKQKITRTSRNVILECEVSDETAILTIKFMHFNAGMKQATKEGTQFRILGKVESITRTKDFFKDEMIMVHPRIRSSKAKLANVLTARYPSIGKIPENILRKIINQELVNLAKDEAQQVRFENFRILHCPAPAEFNLIQDNTIINNLKKDEWLAHILFKNKQKNSIKHNYVPKINYTKNNLSEFTQALDFALTKSQEKAISDITNDLTAKTAMRRLIHGDVGCGKTIVAAFASFLVAKANYQVAFMCPTTILAVQHYNRLSKLFTKLKLDSVLLTSAIRGKERIRIIEQINKEKNLIIFGTHSLLQEKVVIPNLGLAIIDEQQRFSVAQRKTLEKKAKIAHALMLSATPIPITLELGMLSHLDISRILERPFKSEIKTLIFSQDRINDILQRINQEQLQTFWICPLIRSSDQNDLRAAEDEYQKIKKYFPDLATALIHSGLDSKDKLAAMQDFESGKTRLLIATTVVEVGIDAPEADVIVIDHAERLGLSQLHQLRGRVGRSGRAGFCALLYDENLSKTAIQRLKIIHSTDDGFEIAKEDLRLRGPGDLIGKRQSRTDKYRFADLFDDYHMLQEIKMQAQEMLISDPIKADNCIDFWLGGMLQG